MRKIVVYELLSLDGVAEEPDSFFADWDDAMDANLAAVIATQDAVILGRRSYTEWAQFWPGSQIQPFATFINGVTKYVATSTPLDRDWANATVIDGMRRPCSHPPRNDGSPPRRGCRSRTGRAVKSTTSTPTQKSKSAPERAREATGRTAADGGRPRPQARIWQRPLPACHTDLAGECFCARGRAHSGRSAT